MNRLHKNVKVSLKNKLYGIFLVLILYGVYKNGILPVINNFYNISQIFLIILYPLCGFLIGYLFDKCFKNRYFLDNKFYGLLFSLFIPLSTNIFLFLIILVLLLFLNTFLISDKEWDFNFLVFGKLLLVLILFYLNKYNYANLLEDSNLFVYSYIDTIFGHNVSGIFTSNTFLLLLFFGILNFDIYYKSIITYYSYGMYLLTLVIYAFIKSDMTFILGNIFNSTILFSLIILAPLPTFSPYSPKKMALYSIILGILILPFSLLTNFFEGVYIALLIVNIIFIFINYYQVLKFKKNKS